IAPVIVDLEKDEVYFTPLYHTMAHFSKYIRPGAIRIGLDNSDPSLLATAAKNPDGSVAVVLFNDADEEKTIDLSLNEKSTIVTISAKAIQTIVVAN
ncbi:MAG: glycosyl hydrolase family 30, partial [Maribacter sp.]|nr:glycosyl hydrolase family 30 [Maribacter sp.]